MPTGTCVTSWTSGGQRTALWSWSSPGLCEVPSPTSPSHGYSELLFLLRSVWVPSSPRLCPASVLCFSPYVWGWWCILPSENAALVSSLIASAFLITLLISYLLDQGGCIYSCHCHVTLHWRVSHYKVNKIKIKAYGYWARTKAVLIH